MQSSRLSEPIIGSIALARGKPLRIGDTLTKYLGYAVSSDTLYIKSNNNVYIMYDIATKKFSNTILQGGNTYTLFDVTDDGRLLEANFSIDTSTRLSRLQIYVVDTKNSWTRTNRSYPQAGMANGATNGCVVYKRETNTLYLIQSTTISTNSPCRVWYRDLDDITSAWNVLCDTMSIYNYGGGLTLNNAVYSPESNSIYYTCDSTNSSSATNFIKVSLDKTGSYTVLGTINASSTTKHKLIVYENNTENGTNIYVASNINSTNVLCCSYETCWGNPSTVSNVYNISKIADTMYFYQLDKYNCLTTATVNKGYMFECFTANIVMLPILTSASVTLYCTAMNKGNYLLDYFQTLTTPQAGIVCINQETGEMECFNPKVVHDIIASTTGSSDLYYCSSDVLYEATGFTLVFANRTGVLIV